MSAVVPPPPAGFGDSPDHKPGGSNVVGAGLGQGNLLRGTVNYSNFALNWTIWQDVFAFFFTMSNFFLKIFDAYEEN